MLPSLDPVKTMMLILGGSAVAITALEGVLIARARGKDAYDWKAFWTTIRINVWRAIMESSTASIAVIGVALPFGAWCYEHRFFTVPMNTWWGWVAMFFTTEFFYYWLHRTGHRVRWYWASHAIHHSGNQYNLAAAFRQSVTGKISGGFVFFAPQCFLGFSPDAVLISYGVNLAYQFWIHTDLINKMGWMEGWLNTPSAHRVHHAANVEYLDANYGGTIMVFDRLFGTYVPEKDGVPIRYGLVKQVTTNSALKILFAEWIGIFKDVFRARRLRDALGYMFMPPGWAPNGQGLTTEDLRREMKALTGSPTGVPPEALLDRGAVVAVAKAKPSVAVEATQDVEAELVKG
jgi:sterol desaturase/sphingolipid hydroxylase (fatty acid hydroxylase superfamily)